MIGGYADSQNLAEGVVIMAGEQGLDGAAGGQLQAVEGGGAEEDLAGDGGGQRAAGLADNVVRTQQHVHSTARRQLIGAIAAQHTQLGLYRVRDRKSVV